MSVWEAILYAAVLAAAAGSAVALWRVERGVRALRRRLREGAQQRQPAVLNVALDVPPALTQQPVVQTQQTVPPMQRVSAPVSVAPLVPAFPAVPDPPALSVPERKPCVEAPHAIAHSPLCDGPEVYVRETGDGYEIGNMHLTRGFSTAGGRCATTHVINKRIEGGRTYTPQPGSENFVVRLRGPYPEPAATALPTASWRAEASSWSLLADGNGSAQCLIDGDPATYWQSNTGSGEGPRDYPHSVVIDLGANTRFQAFSYAPPADGTGSVSTCRLRAGDQRDAMATVAEGAFMHRAAPTVFINLPEAVETRFVELECVSAQNGRNVAAGSSFALYAGQVDLDDGAQIRSSELELQGVNTSKTDGRGGQYIEFVYKPKEFTSSAGKKATYTLTERYTMYDGECFMRKRVGISVPSDQRANAVIDYVDMERLVCSAGDAIWGHPACSGRETGLSGYAVAAGQPVYVQGMYCGLEFPVAESHFEGLRGHVRYYSGKSLQQLADEGRVDKDGVFYPWRSIWGAARGCEPDAVAADFFEYLQTLALPNKMRTQYNSWYDWMLDIDENNILNSFREIERGLTGAGLAPLDAYVVDDGWNAYGPWLPENKAGFWQFNSKFPNELDKPMDLCARMGSSFGLWLGPRGGYVYNDEFAKFIEENKNGERNPASADICVNHKVYLDKLQEFMLKYQKKYDLTYWKLDGWASVPCPRECEHHATGGTNGMYYMTEHWERAVQLLQKLRQEAEGRGQQNLWINITCFVNPSPWFLQYANSVWMQVSGDLDRKDVGLAATVDQVLTYRDGCYYDFARRHQFQFPHGYLYNHDPIYGKANSRLEGSMDDDEFRAYLFVIMCRGTALQNLYYSYNMLDEGQKWAITVQALKWKQDTFTLLRHSTMVGGDPWAAEVYAYSCWDGADGVLAVRNPAPAEKRFSFRLEQAAYQTTVLAFRAVESDAWAPRRRTAGETLEKTLQPGEVAIWRFWAEEPTDAPAVYDTSAHEAGAVKVVFDRWVRIDGATFTVDGEDAQAELLADWRTVRIRLQRPVANGAKVEVRAQNVASTEGVVAPDLQAMATYYELGLIATAYRSEELLYSWPVEGQDRFEPQLFRVTQLNRFRSSGSKEGLGGFTIAFVLRTDQLQQRRLFGQAGVEVMQLAEGTIRFYLGQFGDFVDGRTALAPGRAYHVTAVREPCGAGKVYVDGELDATGTGGHSPEPVAPMTCQLGDDFFAGCMGAIALYDRALDRAEVAALYRGLLRE